MDVLDCYYIGLHCRCKCFDWGHIVSISAKLSLKAISELSRARKYLHFFRLTKGQHVTTRLHIHLFTSVILITFLMFTFSRSKKAKGLNEMSESLLRMKANIHQW